MVDLGVVMEAVVDKGSNGAGIIMVMAEAEVDGYLRWWYNSLVIESLSKGRDLRVLVQ